MLLAELPRGLSLSGDMLWVEVKQSPSYRTLRAFAVERLTAELLSGISLPPFEGYAYVVIRAPNFPLAPDHPRYEALHFIATSPRWELRDRFHESQRVTLRLRLEDIAHQCWTYFTQDYERRQAFAWLGVEEDDDGDD